MSQLRPQIPYTHAPWGCSKAHKVTQSHTKWDNMPEALFRAEPEHCALCFADLE